MSETALEFVERLGATPCGYWSKADCARLLALARRGAETQWRPIETAPKDGTEFQAWVAYNGDRRWLEYHCRFYPETEAFEIWTRVDYDMDGWEAGYIAARWMPLPPPPAGETEHE